MIEQDSNPARQRRTRTSENANARNEQENTHKDAKDTDHEPDDVTDRRLRDAKGDGSGAVWM